ncbi:hypothetical protein V6615_07140 [Oscillospiraceae bacterium PP1C4]
MKRICAAVFCVLLISGCVGQSKTPAEPASSDAQIASSSSSEPLSDEKLPLYDSMWWCARHESNLDKLPPQILMEQQETAYVLSQAIMNTMDYFGTIPDFDGIEHADPAALTCVAIYRTPDIQFPRSFSGGDEGVFEFDPPNHVLGRLVSRERKEHERFLEGMWYADDVAVTLRYLFGDGVEQALEDIPHRGDTLYYYYPQEQIYAMGGAFGGPMWRYPQITAYKTIENGYRVEATMIFALDAETPLEVNDVVLTKENFEQAAKSCARYRFVFKQAEDGRLLLDGVKTLRERQTR